MLIKLMKYDLKYMLRSLLPLYLVMIVLGVLAGAFFPGEGAIEERIYGSGNVSVTAGSGFAVIATAAIIAVTVIAIAVAIVTAMSVIHRFNRNLLGNEGYLSFTLPVTVSEHFFSKAFSSMIVVILGYAAGAVTFLLMGAIYTVRVGDAASVHEFWRLGRDIFSDVFYYDGPAGNMVLMILAAVVSIYQLIAQVFCASAIGSQARERKGFMGVLAFIGLAIAEAVVTSLTGLSASGIGMLIYFQPDGTTMLAGSLARNCAFAAAYSAGTIWLLKNRLNLQ